MHLYDVHDKTVIVVDVLRATSCMVTALANGATSIIPMANLEDCKKMKASGYITSGERNGEMAEGFDKGNSPFEYLSNDIVGKKIAFTTTNGTQSIEKAKDAKELAVGSFLNLSAIASHLQSRADDILIVCAGWKGHVNLEDTLFAGALAEKLKPVTIQEDDAALMAIELYQQAKNNLVKFLNQSSHVKRLNKLNIHKDMEFCLTADKYSVVPVLVNDELKLL